MTIPLPLGLLARGWDGRSLALHSVEDHASPLAVISESVFPLAAFGQDAEPFLGDLGRGELAVML